MSVTTNGFLTFGIHLEEWDEEVPAFLDGIYNESFDELIYYEAGLADSWSGDKTAEERQEYYRERREARESYPVRLLRFCSANAPCWILYPNLKESHFRVNRGYVVDIPSKLPTFKPKVLQGMQAWCKTHDVKWREPAWLLTSYWSGG